MAKIQMKTPLVEMDGDEMTRIIWKQIKDIIILPYVDLKTEYFDLGLKHRDETADQVTIDAANRTNELGVAVKCATITPNAQRMTEYNLHTMWKSPNGTIRAILDGTVFRAPILVKGIKPFVSCWEKPITIARHAYGDVYRDTEYRVEGPARANLVITYPDGRTESQTIFEFTGDGIVEGLYNTDKSIEAFASSCFQYALDTKQDLWFATKDTISKTYDHRFKDIFQEMYDRDYKEKFEAAGITYFYTLIDDAVARVMRSSGGFVWALKNYDGDVMSDMLASACGSLAMMTSVLVSPKGVYEYEAAQQLHVIITDTSRVSRLPQTRWLRFSHGPARSAREHSSTSFLNSKHLPTSSKMLLSRLLKKASSRAISTASSTEKTRRS